MSQNISDFYNAAMQKDFARKFQFRVVQLANTNLKEDSFVYLETAQLPGRDITNVPVPFMGLDFNVPGTAKYVGSDAYNVVFRCDANYDIRAVLENATFNTFDDATSTGDYNIARNSSIVTIDLLNKQNKAIRQYNLVGAYVKSIGAMEYALADTGTVVTVPAVIAYQYWRVTKASKTTIPASTVLADVIR